ncbi:MAG: rhodanese-like domain-containing protein [Pseudomonadota bacterium]|nr:rhodanese-like domain-containing protein [Pseudomonadota bacterium]
MYSKKTFHCALLLAAFTSMPVAAPAIDQPVGISTTLEKLTFTADGKQYAIERNPDNQNTVAPDYALTSRPCPPFCIQPMNLAPGVETVGELEVIDYLDQKYNQGNDGILLIDSRTRNWVEKGVIPGAVNIPWTKLYTKKGATPESIIDIMTGRLGVKLVEGKDVFDVDEALAQSDLTGIFDFSGSRTLVLYCNGMWCGQSPISIQTLLQYGYPAEKLKWYRGGMQDWQILGLTTVAP